LTARTKGHRRLARHRESEKAAPDQRILALAEGWGSRFVEQGRDSEESAWQQAQNLVLRLTARVVERDMRIANCFPVD
jgi:hypothetical protein